MENPYAFPSEVKEGSNQGFPVPRIIHFGMTLRDWYAGKALEGMLSQFPEFKSNGMDARTIKEDLIRHQNNVAKRCYEYADAMLAQRHRGIRSLAQSPG